MSGEPMLTAEEFSRALRAEGFQEIVQVEREANGRLELHSHPFASRALVLAGEIRIVVDGRESVYRAGDIFELAHGQPHAERYGFAGVRYLVGRK